MKSQNDKILAHMKRRGSITALDAVRFGCLRLAARIAELRDMGIQINSKLETKRKKTYARYTLA